MTSQSSAGTFDYPYDTTLRPTGGSNFDAARTNTFYIINKVHDYAYDYGQTEMSYNFQNSIFGKGRAEGDHVLPCRTRAEQIMLISLRRLSMFFLKMWILLCDYVHSGQSGTCRVYIWTLMTPNRNGTLQNDIIVHEFMHGITNRLTGDGALQKLKLAERTKAPAFCIVFRSL